ncbi:MAG: FKBP-type peptidyl-prolyl cis-trans isomerase [Bacteroidales bacterium]|nr:FKBP-type peptidyl-prolyl cis-trans isomerase [Bacteroidales bacterium]
MKKFIIIAAAAVCLCAACGKTAKVGNNDAAKRHFEAWVHVNKQDHPEYVWKQTSLGSWILEEEEGSGAALESFEDSLYVRVDYTFKDEYNEISASSYARIAQQTGGYDESCYYGTETWYANGLTAGIKEVLKGMKRGGRRTVIIPGWLQTYNTYNTEAEYLAQKSDDIGTTVIADIRLDDFFLGIQQWSADSVGRYLVARFPSVYGTDPAKAAADSSGTFGFWYMRTGAPTSEEEIKDSTVYINYTGRLLNGQVFDTTIRDTAIRYGLSRDKTYEPVSITYSDTWSKITMGSESTTVIPGFARTLSKMKAGEKGTGIFIQSLGYGYKGSGLVIPSYAPLRFDVELVAKP